MILNSDFQLIVFFLNFNIQYCNYYSYTNVFWRQYKWKNAKAQYITICFEGNKRFLHKGILLAQSKDETKLFVLAVPLPRHTFRMQHYLQALHFALSVHPIRIHRVWVNHRGIVSVDILNEQNTFCPLVYQYLSGLLCKMFTQPGKQSFLIVTRTF